MELQWNWDLRLNLTSPSHTLWWWWLLIRSGNNFNHLSIKIFFLSHNKIHHTNWLRFHSTGNVHMLIGFHVCIFFSVSLFSQIWNYFHQSRSQKKTSSSGKMKQISKIKQKNDFCMPYNNRRKIKLRSTFFDWGHKKCCG